MAFRASFWARNIISRPTIGKSETRSTCRRRRANIGNQGVGIHALVSAPPQSATAALFQFVR